MRDNVKATKALVDEYLGARRNVINDAGEEYEHPHPQLDMFADLKKFSLRYSPGEDEVIDRFVKTVDLARETGVHFLVLTRMQIMLNMALSEDSDISLRKKCMAQFCDLYDLSSAHDARETPPVTPTTTTKEQQHGMQRMR